MDQAEREAICKRVAIISMWGHGWVGSILMAALDKDLPSSPSWQELYDSLVKAARREHVGVITNEDDLLFWMYRGYWLTNWDEGGCALFKPPPMNGLYKYVSKPLADKHKSPFGVQGVTTP